MIADIDANIGQISGNFGEQIRLLEGLTVALVCRRCAIGSADASSNRTLSTGIDLLALVLPRCAALQRCLP
jgi:hypothetical protein